MFLNDLTMLLTKESWTQTIGRHTRHVLPLYYYINQWECGNSNPLFTASSKMVVLYSPEYVSHTNRTGGRIAEVKCVTLSSITVTDPENLNSNDPCWVISSLIRLFKNNYCINLQSKYWLQLNVKQKAMQCSWRKGKKWQQSSKVPLKLHL